jgi:hypothetical protein
MHLDILRLAITASSLTALAGCAAPSLHAAAPPPPPPRGFIPCAAAMMARTPFACVTRNEWREDLLVSQARFCTGSRNRSA